MTSVGSASSSRRKRRRDARSATRARLKALRSIVLPRPACAARRSAGNRVPRSPMVRGCAPVGERVLDRRRNVPARHRRQGPTEFRKRFGCPHELEPAASQGRLRSGGRAHGALSERWTARQRRSRGRQMPAATRRTVGPGSRTRECVDRHTDRLQEADERAVMLACVAHPARGQDRGGALAAAPIRSTCGTRSRAARSGRHHPRSRRRRNRSVSSEYRKKPSSRPPASSSAARRISTHPPESQSGSPGRA